MRLSQRLLRSPSLATPTFVSVVLLSGGSFSAIAAVTDAIPAIDAGSLTRQQEHQRSEAERASHPSPALIDVRPSATKSTGTSDVKAMVNSVHFSGGRELLSPAERSVVSQQVTGRLLDFSALQALVNSITDTLHKKGYMFARAYLPSQDVTAGKLDIVIAEGRLDGSPSQPVGWIVNLPAGSRRPAQTWSDMAEAALPSGSVIKESSLERGLLLINDVPGLGAKGNLLAGEDPGSVRVQLDVNEGKRFEGYLWADNYGSDSTGRAQGHALVNINDPFGFKDQASLQISTSQGVNLGRLGYGFGMGPTGLRASIGYSQLSYDVVKGVGKAAGLEGKSNIVSVNLSYPFIRTQRRNFRGGLGVDRKAFKDESRLGVLRDKRSNVVTLSIGGDFVNDSRLAGFNLWRLAVATGDLDLSGVPSDAAVDANTRKTQGRWTKLNAYYSYQQPLPAGFSVQGWLEGQYAEKNLDSSEQFTLGGPSDIRAYPVGEAQGDRGGRASLELRYDVPKVVPSLGRLQLATFVDTGNIAVNSEASGIAIPSATGRNNYALKGWGLGASLFKPNQYSLRLAWAHKIGANAGRSIIGDDVDGKHHASRVWMQGILWF